MLWIWLILLAGGLFGLLSARLGERLPQALDAHWTTFFHLTPPPPEDRLAIPTHVAAVLAGAMVAAINLLLLGPGETTLTVTAFAGLLLAAAFADYLYLVLPFLVSAPLAGVGLLLAAARSPLFLAETALNGLAAALVCGALHAVLSRRSADAFGFGDVVFLAAIAIWLGAPGAVACLVIGACAAAIGRLSARRTNEPQPFGPYLAASAWLLALATLASPNPWTATPRLPLATLDLMGTLAALLAALGG